MSTLQLVLEALPRMKLEHGTHLPETRLPALHPFSAIETAASGVQKLASIETAVESGETGVSDLLSGFARFVAALGGLEELAFGFSAGPAQHSIVHAAVTENSSIVLQVVDGETEDGGLDFLLELKLEEEVGFGARTLRLERR